MLPCLACCALAWCRWQTIPAREALTNPPLLCSAALQVADGQQRSRLLATIEPHLPSVRKYTYGKHIVARLDAMLAAERQAQQVKQAPAPTPAAAAAAAAEAPAAIPTLVPAAALVPEGSPAERETVGEGKDSAEAAAPEPAGPEEAAASRQA
jgi:hypothetical protein